MKRRFDDYRWILLILLFTPTTYAKSINWDIIPEKEITLFYPGQASWEWILTNHNGSKSVRKGSPCLECHDGEEKQMGTAISKGAKLEPSPIIGKPGFTTLFVRMAQDDANFYLHLQWKETGFRSGKKMDPEFPTKLAIMIDDGGVKESSVGGCFGICHDDATGMPSHNTEKERMLYLSTSREKITRSGGGDAYKSKDELAELFEQGAFLELWQIKLSPGQRPIIDEGYVMERRHVDNTHHVEMSFDYQNGLWSLELRRPLNADSPAHKKFQSGKKYIIGFALHEDYVKGRHHYVSFGRSFAFDGQKTDIKVIKQ